MSMTVTANSRARGQGHFSPEAELDPVEHRKLRGHLEQIDYASFAANREVIARVLSHADLERFEHLAVAAAQARADWVAAAVTMTEKSRTLASEQVEHLAALRSAYDELSAAYEALRRMVERGYLHYRAKS
jgi:hypothetical protein